MQKTQVKKAKQVKQTKQNTTDKHIKKYGHCCLDTCCRCSLCFITGISWYTCCCPISPILACLSVCFSDKKSKFTLDEQIVFRPPCNIAKELWKHSYCKEYLYGFIGSEKQ